MSAHPSYCCQQCGECIGWIGRAMEWLFGAMHKHRKPRGYGSGTYLENWQ